MKKIVSFNNRRFRYVYKHGKSYGNKMLVMYYTPNGLNYNRLGISVSKKLGNSVVRHRVKRLIKESFRINSGYFKSGYDIILIAKMGVEQRSYKEVESAVLHLMKKNEFINKG